MKMVTLRPFGSAQTLVLDPVQTRLFENELRRITRRLPHLKGMPYAVAPDCFITVAGGARKTEYSLHARTVLTDTATKKSWQFYFGVLLTEWLWK